jgi:hypothetical protein
MSFISLERCSCARARPVPPSSHESLSIFKPYSAYEAYVGPSTKAPVADQGAARVSRWGGRRRSRSRRSNSKNSGNGGNGGNVESWSVQQLASRDVGGSGCDDGRGSGRGSQDTRGQSREWLKRGERENEIRKTRRLEQLLPSRLFDPSSTRISQSRPAWAPYWRTLDLGRRGKGQARPEQSVMHNARVRGAATDDGRRATEDRRQATGDRRQTTGDKPQATSYSGDWDSRRDVSLVAAPPSLSLALSTRDPS